MASKSLYSGHPPLAAACEWSLKCVAVFKQNWVKHDYVTTWYFGRLFCSLFLLFLKFKTVCAMLFRVPSQNGLLTQVSTADGCFDAKQLYGLHLTLGPYLCEHVNVDVHNCECMQPHIVYHCVCVCSHWCSYSFHKFSCWHVRMCVDAVQFFNLLRQKATFRTTVL